MPAVISLVANKRKERKKKGRGGDISRKRGKDDVGDCPFVLFF